jgi:predicted ATP-dependent serine protease
MSSVQAQTDLTATPLFGTRARSYICVICKKTFRTKYLECPECHGDKTLIVLDEKLSRGRGFIRADQYEAPFRETYSAGDWGAIFPRGIEGGTIILLRGLGGAGKTRLAMKLAVAIAVATDGGRAGILSFENPTADVVRSAEGVGISLEDLLVSDAQWEEAQLRSAAQAGIVALVIDSVQKMGDKPSLYYDSLKEWVHGGNGGRVLIVISQSNAKGGTRGGLSIEYDLAECVARVEETTKPGIARVIVDKKNRFGPLGKFEAPLVSGRARLKRVK